MSPRRTGPYRFSVRPGFTLIELLVVVAIIALLVGLAVPALFRARETTLVIVCLNTQRGLMQATTAYSTDYAGMVMPTSSNIEREELAPDTPPEVLYWAIGDNVPHTYTVAISGTMSTSTDVTPNYNGQIITGFAERSFRIDIDYELTNHGLLVASYNVENDELYYCPAQQAQLFTRDEYPFPWLRSPQTTHNAATGTAGNGTSNFVRSGYNYAPYNGPASIADPTRNEWSREVRDRVYGGGIAQNDVRWGMRAYRTIDDFPADRPVFIDQIYTGTSSRLTQSRSHYGGQAWNLVFVDGSAVNKRNPMLRRELDELILSDQQGGSYIVTEILPGNDQQNYTRNPANVWWQIHDLVNDTGGRI